MQPIYIEAQALGADPVAVCEAQTIPEDQALVLNGTYAADGQVVFPFPRRLTARPVDSSAEGITLTVTGTDEAGSGQIERFRLLTAGQDVVGKLEFLTIEEVTANIGGIGDVEVGTSGVVGSNWARLDNWAIGPTIIQITAVGTANYTLQTTLDDPNSFAAPIDPDDVRWFPSTDPNVVNATGSRQTKLDVNPTFVRLLINSGTGTVAATILQTGGSSF
jgi:hypothetical protein